MNAERYLTVRKVPDEVAKALEKERDRLGKSLNQTVIDVLKRGLGIGSEKRSNGIAKLAGKWSVEEFREFENFLKESRKIDPAIWES